ncbi:MAG: response regulator transcription factor [Alphaproteobacteria bacterium]|nr:response regulator transcription factor [Alphaproteobacteria bacterium]
MKFLIADDHGLFREGLRLVLLQLDRDLTVVEASDFDQALRLAATESELRIILLDLAMPGMPWTEALPALRALVPDVPVVILSALEEPDLVLQAIELGAAGFIPKSSNSKVMVGALNLVLGGGVYLPPTLSESDSALDDATLALNGAVAARLTRRQQEVLVLVGEGRSNKEIARHLSLSEGTVKLHVTAILKALGVNNRTRAVVAASQMGFAALPRSGIPSTPDSYPQDSKPTSEIS